MNSLPLCGWRASMHWLGILPSPTPGQPSSLRRAQARSARVRQWTIWRL